MKYIVSNYFLRIDKCDEYVRIGRFMVVARRIDRGSLMVGKSLHNQRIERLLVEIFNVVLSVFHRKFS